MRGRSRHDRLRHFAGDWCDISRIEKSLEYRKATRKEINKATGDILEELGLTGYRLEKKKGEGEYGVSFV